MGKEYYLSGAVRIEQCLLNWSDFSHPSTKSKVQSFIQIATKSGVGETQVIHPQAKFLPSCGPGKPDRLCASRNATVGRAESMRYSLPQRQKEESRKGRWGPSKSKARQREFESLKAQD